MDNVDFAESVRTRWARRLVREKVAKELNILTERLGEVPGIPPPNEGRFLGGGYSHDNLPSDPLYSSIKPAPLKEAPRAEEELPSRKVCIVGAGVSGLYIAMILDDLKIPNLTYDIFESSSRTGGRLYTHHFTDAKHDYYDIGAMRYPDIPSMKRTFNLFKRTGMPLIKYYLDGENTPQLYNNHFFAKGVSDPYMVSVANGGTVPDDVVDSVGEKLQQAFGYYKEKLAEDFDKGFDELMLVDDMTTREYLKRGGPKGEAPKYDFFAIQWMETQNTGTNLFDQAFSESVIDSFDFDNPTKPEWYCIEGGTSLLVDAMEETLVHKVQNNKRVDAISIDLDAPDDGNMSVRIGGKDYSGYSTVFNTTALGCLDRMDLRGLNLHPTQVDAIRCLHYDNSTKVALKFSYPWWIKDCGITCGGAASTDLPLRTCVYPSYNLDDGDGEAVLLASYTWSQDATRIGSLVKDAPPQPPKEDELVELILQNLARLHAEHMTYEKIKEAYTGVYHAYCWANDPNVGGAFALFGPGQFSNLYPYLMRPAAGGKFHIVGEASSVHHAWIIGSLESAYTAVYQFLYKYKMWDYLRLLLERWQYGLQELETGKHGTAHLQFILGSLPKEYQVKV
ncbi:hypothetical protein N5P37_010194 [Trichoderma harzianum]|uniref:Amine oxidase domain-containing protein n=1 Tax=Trichoderma harzianum CBS 226.95 TaxID=983964 RepID=A0A2T4A4V3_TRIHA|nr:hypothetical protein M431DRAFT_510303 [Trichoderma harzianum CBS 226.95]KAK0757469.1 hypothetical protein N5P37_010194 [Trichoderma harzianum]PKK55211.1 hypothetical protein CI102_12 [Trichoderma harzianum]PTB52099.1 hypothetical protein M431DRAFT_510303 [Trichoderma harzianum CBS 226.95]